MNIRLTGLPGPDGRGRPGPGPDAVGPVPCPHPTDPAGEAVCASGGPAGQTVTL